MKIVKALAVVSALALTVAAPAFAQSEMEQGHSMLTQALINSLNQRGLDASNVDDLTLNEIAEIRGIMENDQPTNQQDSMIENILNN